MSAACDSAGKIFAARSSTCCNGLAAECIGRGAGKTTFASKFLPDFVNCREFLNADLIAAGLAPFAPETQNVRAGRLLLERVKELTAAKMDFSFETTLSGRTYVRLLQQMKSDGYRVYL